MADKIVYIGSNIPDKSPAGVRVFANALALKDYGYDVKIISKDVDYQLEFDVISEIETWHFPSPRSKKEWITSLYDVRLYSKIIDRIGDVKVVIAYELPSIVFLRLRRFCKLRGIKLICETAEWQKWENLGHLGFIARLVRLFDINVNMYYAYNKGDAIIVTSSYFAKHFKKFRPVLSLPTLQYHIIELDNNTEPHYPRKFIYAGGLGYKKDMLSEIIHAFGDVSDLDFEFNILGLSKEQYTGRFKEDIALIESLNHIKEKIRFWGKVSHGEVLKELTRSDFSLIIRQSSYRNNVGFPTKFGESINCGTPVIVSDFSDVVYYTQKFDLGIVTNVESIASGIRKALEMDDESFMQMRQRCKECAVFHYRGSMTSIGDFVKNVINK